MEKSSQIAWKLVPLKHFFPLKVVPFIEVLLCTWNLEKSSLVTGSDRFPAWLVIKTRECFERAPGWVGLESFVAGPTRLEVEIPGLLFSCR
jgi:hypothetical protein